MCGIIGYTGKNKATPILLKGLSKLEYRGYDSSGIAVISPSGGVDIWKSDGNLAALLKIINEPMPEGTTGIGHTRWATHGAPTDFNAHPHTDCRNEIAVVHNGIVENFLELKRGLENNGHIFTSQTDSECIPHLIEEFMQQNFSLEDATKMASERIQGAHAVLVTSTQEPEKLVAFRLGNAGGLVVGYGTDEMFIASDLPAILPYTSKVAYLAGGEAVSTTGIGANYSRLDGSSVEKCPSHIQYDSVTSAKGEYKHFMLKEINEQPQAVIDTMRHRVSFDKLMVDLEEIHLSNEEIKDINKVVLVGMGTSLHAAMVGRTWIEKLARIPAEVDNSSEFRYRNPIIDNRTLVISVCQSGETVDTLAAMEEASSKGAKQITLCNYDGTQTTRVAAETILIRAGIEIGVAASKTFMCSLTSLYLLSLYLGHKRGTIGKTELSALVQELTHLPKMLGSMLSDDVQYTQLANEFTEHSNFLYLGRGTQYPLALEGALKLKEISYIHAEGYQAGEMKHGPISLIDEKMPVVALAPSDQLYEKMIGNVNEAKARGGMVIAIATEGNSEIAGLADHVIYIPNTSSDLTPMLIAVPMQLLAYHIAMVRGCNIDQPRNLAKSVTVE